MFKNVSFSFLLSGLLFSCGGENALRGKDSLEIDTTVKKSIHENVGLQDLQGCWTTYGIESRGGCNGPVTESSAESIAEIRSWYIKGDSIWIFRYPCAFYEAQSFKLKNDSLYFDSDRFASEHVKFENGILILTSVNCETRNFFRDTLDINLLNILKRDSINMECLVVKMKLVTDSYIKGDGGTYKLTFPMSLPATINIPDKESAKNIYKTKTIMLNVGGKEKLFNVTKIQWDNFGDNFATAVDKNGKQTTVITLHPAEWWKGEIFFVSYEEE